MTDVRPLSLTLVGEPSAAACVGDFCEVPPRGAGSASDAGAREASASAANADEASASDTSAGDASASV